jgi:hydrogenase maturation protease
MIRIIGIGSPFGDDAAGLEAARQLAADPPPGSEVVEADRPGATLIDLFAGADAAILIDAARSGAPAGTIHDLDLHALQSHPLGLISSHDLGVAAAVQLAATLGQLPPRGRVLAIEAAAGGSGAWVDVCAGVRGGVTEAVSRAQSWCAVYRETVRPTEESGSRRGVGSA